MQVRAPASAPALDKFETSVELVVEDTARRTKAPPRVAQPPPQASPAAKAAMQQLRLVKLGLITPNPRLG